MLGLFFVAGSEEMVARGPGLLASNRTREHWRAQGAAGARCHLGVVSLSGDAIRESGDGRWLCAVDGWMAYGENDWRGCMPGVAAALMEEGGSAAARCRGEFTAVAIDTEQQRAVVVNDRFGRRLAYIHTANGSLQVSTDIRGLFENGLAEPALNRSYLATLLRLNKVRPGTTTLFSGIRVLPPASCLEVDFGAEPKTRERIYYCHSFDREDELPPDWHDGIIDCIRSSMERAMDRAGGPVGVTLSGGLDSRLLVAAAPPERRRRMVAASYGLEGSTEAAIARRVGRVAGINVRNVPIGPDDYLSLAEEAPAKNEEYDIFVQAAQALPGRNLAHDTDYIMSGWDLDIGLRGLYTDDEVMGLGDLGAVPETIFRKWELFSREELKLLLKPEFHRAYGDGPDDAVRAALAEVPGESPVKRYLGFIFQYEKQRLLMLRSRFIRHELETVTPFYDEELQAMLATVPEHRRANNRLFQELFARLDPALLELTYQRTMLPGDVDTRYWAEGARVEQARETLYRRIYQETGRLVEYKRYYSNFAQWLLSDEGWRGFVDRTFLSGDALLFEEIADRQYVRELIERDRRSEKSEFKKIVHLISLELYLREYFAG